MTTFHYRAFTAGGDLREGDIDAGTLEEAEDALWRQGLTPFETEIVAGSGPGAERQSFRIGGRRGPNVAEIAGFTREFATLEQASIPLDQSLRLMASQTASPAQAELAADILKRIVDGASLSEALSHRSDAFNEEYLNIVRAGEAIGDVGASLANLAETLERRLELRGRIQSALIYPALLITLAIISTGVVVGTLVPSVAPIFADNGKDMPAGLKLIIDAEAQWPWFVGALAALIAGGFMLRSMARARPPLGIALDHFFLRLPQVGELLALNETARFARTLGAMTTSRAPLLQGLESARAVVGNRYLKHQLEAVIDAVRSGAGLSASLAGVDKFPPLATQMIGVGEEVGKVDVMLLRVASMFERQTQRSIERVMGLVTPVLTILIAVVVGGLIMTVMDAVLGINELATK